MKQSPEFVSALTAKSAGHGPESLLFSGILCLELLLILNVGLTAKKVAFVMVATEGQGLTIMQGVLLRVSCSISTPSVAGPSL